MYFRFLWMTLCFHSMEPKAQDEARRYISVKFIRWRYQLDIRQPVFGQVHQNAALGAKYAIYYCLVCEVLTTVQYVIRVCYADQLPPLNLFINMIPASSCCIPRSRRRNSCDRIALVVLVLHIYRPR